MKISSPLRTLILALLVAVASYLIARVGDSFIISRQAASALWPGCAFLVSILLLVPRRTWPALITAGLLGFVARDLQFYVQPRSLTAFLFADTIEIVIVALGLSYSFNGIPRLNSLKSLIQYCFWAVILGPVVCSFVGAFAYPGFYWTSWRLSFFSEALAFLTLTPAILSWANVRFVWSRKSLPSQLETAALVGALILLGYSVFLLSWKSIPPGLLYSLVPLLLWAALRFGSRGVSTSVIFLAFVSIYGSIHDRGPFTGPDPLENVLSLQLFLIFAATPFMVLAALAEERERDQEALSSVSRRLIDAQEQERAWIARELHDDICQRLAMLSTQFQKAAKGWNSGPLPVSNQFERIREQCTTLTGDVQTLSRKLHPSMLDNLGLVTAVRSYCREFSEQTGAVVDNSETNIPKSLPREISLSLFRVIQEALHNSIKHSGEKKFQVSLQATSDEIEVEVSDRGVGFDVASVINSSGLGLVSMAERIHLVHGTFSVESQPNAGTRIRARVPLETRDSTSTGTVKEMKLRPS
ncbi:MAG TPA: sensor histidine kinase [Candidatus Acidoferrum sp.]|nr:sensor histidine kinase [Candidatus Acidoferrum sp.]